MMKSVLRATLPVALCLGLSSAPALAQQSGLPRADLRAGLFRIDAEVAATPQARETGLMYRRSMAQHEGMLFVFDSPQEYCFWMKNTPLPLSIAFIADDGTIVNLADMQPQTETNHCAARPVRYALEMNLGWFSAKGIKAGAKISGLAP